MVEALKKRTKLFLVIWLSVLMLMVAGTVLVGGVTRLTNSGLSITEWKPLVGALPPLTDHAWSELFEKYKQIPEYSIEHSDMDLQGFKFIFFWEWFHRNLGRAVGLTAILPLLLMWSHIPLAFRKRFSTGVILVGLQGLMGWFMVKSGLADRVDVSHYRLAAHLVLAFLIFSHYQRMFMDVLNFGEEQDALGPPRGVRAAVLFVHSLLGVQIVYGAFVAGLRAGYMYNTYPKMGSDWVPVEGMVYHPLWLSAFENPITVQFVHRWLAVLVMVCAVVLPWFMRRQGALNLVRSAQIFLGVTVFQAGLGIATLVLKMPLAVASLHQVGGLVAFAAMTVLMHRTRSRSVTVTSGANPELWRQTAESLTVSKSTPRVRDIRFDQQLTTINERRVR